MDAAEGTTKPLTKMIRELPKVTPPVFCNISSMLQYISKALFFMYLQLVYVPFIECSFLDLLHIFHHFSVFHNKYLGTFLSDMENIATKDIGKPFTPPKKIHVHFWCRTENVWVMAGCKMPGRQVSTFQRNVEAVFFPDALIPTYQTTWRHRHRRLDMSPHCHEPHILLCIGFDVCKHLIATEL